MSPGKQQTFRFRPRLVLLLLYSGFSIYLILILHVLPFIISKDSSPKNVFITGKSFCFVLFYDPPNHEGWHKEVKGVLSPYNFRTTEGINTGLF